MMLLFACSIVPKTATADSWWGTDKAAHLGVGTALGAVSYGFLWSFGENPSWLRFTVANALALVPALGKEIYDETRDNNYFSGKDLVWSWIGILIGTGVMLAVDLVTKQDTESSGVPELVSLSHGRRIGMAWKF